MCQGGNPGLRVGPGGRENGAARAPCAGRRRGGREATARAAGPLAGTPPLRTAPITPSGNHRGSHEGPALSLAGRMGGEDPAGLQAAGGLGKG